VSVEGKEKARSTKHPGKGKKKGVLLTYTTEGGGKRRTNRYF